MKNRILNFIFFIFIFIQNNFGIDPNPILSRGKDVYTSSGKVSYLVDNKFSSQSWSVKNNSWIAIKLDSCPSKVFFTWNCPDYAWSNELSPAKCPNSISFPVNYNFLISDNSTNGEDGDWQIVDSIRNNIVCTRGHLLDCTNAKWLKMAIIKGGGTIDEIEVFDASNNKDDTWFFVGTSITANAFKGTPPALNFADVVNSKHKDYTPSMIRGGIGCISSSDFVGNLSKYLKMAGNVHFWAIEMGTNDAWGGSNANVNTFKNNLQIVIDSCRKYGIEPIIARVLATNQSLANWQVHPDFLKAVDELTEKNNLIKGPDLYTWFLAHPNDLNSDGVHPNASGAASIQRLWAEKMDSLYGGCIASEIIPYIQINQDNDTLLAYISAFEGDTIKIKPQSIDNGTWAWTGPNNFSSYDKDIILNNVTYDEEGYYIVSFTNENSCVTQYPFKLNQLQFSQLFHRHGFQNWIPIDIYTLHVATSNLVTSINKKASVYVRPPLFFTL